MKKPRVFKGHGERSTTADTATRKRERELSIEAAREVESSPGKATEYENPEDFFAVVRQMKEPLKE